MWTAWQGNANSAPHRQSMHSGVALRDDICLRTANSMTEVSDLLAAIGVQKTDPSGPKKRRREDSDFRVKLIGSTRDIPDDIISNMVAELSSLAVEFLNHRLYDDSQANSDVDSDVDSDDDPHDHLQRGFMQKPKFVVFWDGDQVKEGSFTQVLRDFVLSDTCRQMMQYDLIRFVAYSHSDTQWGCSKYFTNWGGNQKDKEFFAFVKENHRIFKFVQCMTRTDRDDSMEKYMTMKDGDKETYRQNYGLCYNLNCDRDDVILFNARHRIATSVLAQLEVTDGNVEATNVHQIQENRTQPVTQQVTIPDCTYFKQGDEPLRPIEDNAEYKKSWYEFKRHESNLNRLDRNDPKSLYRYLVLALSTYMAQFNDTRDKHFVIMVDNGLDRENMSDVEFHAKRGGAVSNAEDHLICKSGIHLFAIQCLEQETMERPAEDIQQWNQQQIQTNITIIKPMRRRQKQRR